MVHVRIITYGLTDLLVFHHDSPYDACSPQFNRVNNRTAPINAFDRTEDPITNALLAHHRLREDGQEHATPVEAPNGESYDSNDPYAVPQGMLYDGPTDADNPNSEFFGVRAEPWQEISNPVKSAHNAGRSNTISGGPLSRPEKNFGDMEAILRGGRRADPETIYDNEASRPSMSQDAPEYFVSENQPSERKMSSKSGSISRSKSLLARFRRMRVDSDQASPRSRSQRVQAEPQPDDNTDVAPPVPPLPQKPTRSGGATRQVLASPVVGASDPAPTTISLNNQPEVSSTTVRDAKYSTDISSGRNEPVGYDARGTTLSTYADEPTQVYGSAYSRPSRRNYVEAPEPPPKQSYYSLTQPLYANSQQQHVTEQVSASYADSAQQDGEAVGSAGREPSRRGGFRQLASLSRSRSRSRPRLRYAQ